MLIARHFLTVPQTSGSLTIASPVLTVILSEPYSYYSETKSFHLKKKVFITTVYTLTLNLLTTTIVAPPINASKWQIGFNSAFKGLMLY